MKNLFFTITNRERTFFYQRGWLRPDKGSTSDRWTDSDTLHYSKINIHCDIFEWTQVELEMV